MIEVFKTDVCKIKQSKMLLRVLSKNFPLCKINFDLSDCDKVLRLEGEKIEALQVIKLLQGHGFRCGILN